MSSVSHLCAESVMHVSTITSTVSLMLDGTVTKRRCNFICQCVNGATFYIYIYILQKILTSHLGGFFGWNNYQRIKRRLSNILKMPVAIYCKLPKQYSRLNVKLFNVLSSFQDEREKKQIRCYKVRLVGGGGGPYRTGSLLTNVTGRKKWVGRG
jgi:hypothetical protein